MNKREVRFVPQDVEVRLDMPDGSSVPKLVGYGAVFNSLSDDMGGWREIIRPGAFTRALANNCDVRLLLNHEGLPLARTKSGTLHLSEDQRGLKFEAELDPTDPDVVRILPKMKRGDLNNCSFAFTVLTDTFRSENGQDIREIREFDSLYDVSLVTYPAYPAAGAALRSYQEWKEQQKEAEKVETPAASTPPDVLLKLLDIASLT